ncbi:MAG TPA: response regulator transcription factor [Ktedonobacterales bacterium]|jgi:DNA-binding response OmpR family regulator
MPARKTLILIAGSDTQVLKLLTRCFCAEGYEVISAEEEQQLLEALETREPDLMLLDTLPSWTTDFELCKHVRELSLVPIIVISAQKQGHDKARALDSGADDYLIKPLSVVELLAQVRALLRRIQWNTNEYLRNMRPILTFGDLAVDFLQQRVTKEGHPVALTPIEYRLFSYLAQNAGRIVTHNLLLEKVWGREYLGENNLLKVHINRLRHKIEPDPACPSYIITKTGLGYLLQPQPAVYLPRARELAQEASNGGGNAARACAGY